MLPWVLGLSLCIGCSTLHLVWFLHRVNAQQPAPSIVFAPGLYREGALVETREPHNLFLRAAIAWPLLVVAYTAGLGTVLSIVLGGAGAAFFLLVPAAMLGGLHGWTAQRVMMSTPKTAPLVALCIISVGLAWSYLMFLGSY